VELSELWTAQNLIVLVLWFAVGLLLAWNRGLGLSVLVPLLVAGGPMVVGLRSGSGAVDFFPSGFGGMLLLEGILLPLVASVAGGHVAQATNPYRRAREHAKRAYTRARGESERLTAEIHAIELAFADVFRTAAQSTTVTSEIAILRHQLARRQDELRTIGRELAETA
jgi:hypothetical protein